MPLSSKTAAPARWLALMLSLACCAMAQDKAPSASNRTWITDVTIISPERLDHVEQGSVLIEGERIVSVERKAGAKPPSGATVISGKGQFLIPGLIDSHVHLSLIPGMPLVPDPSQSAMRSAYFKQLPRSYLYYGYTTLVDLAVFDHRVLEDFRNAPSHPDLYDCGEPLSFANGYPMAFLPPAQRFKAFPNFIYDPQQASSIPAEYKPEDHTPAADVDRVKRSGGICVKTFYEHGFGQARNLPVLSPQVMAEIRKAATQDGLVLMVHANAFQAQRFAVDGGADVLAHGMWQWGTLNQQPGLPAGDQEAPG